MKARYQILHTTGPGPKTVVADIHSPRRLSHKQLRQCVGRETGYDIDAQNITVVTS